MFRFLSRFLTKYAVCSLVLLCLGATPGLAQLRYDTEYPVIGYGKTPPTDPFSERMAAVADQPDALRYTPTARGYLDSLLEVLDIDPASQVLVFSKTSLKRRFITADNPRSLFFNDTIYVGFVPGSRTLEIAAMDPNQGPVFFDFTQNPEAPERFEQELGRCLRCHDSYSLTGGGVPRFMLSSVFVDAEGNAVSHELNELTSTATPHARRWGGWYVTGQHGDLQHLGNLIISDLDMLREPGLSGQGNVDDLSALVDLQEYPSKTSDIVALLVLEHQVEVQNRITRLNYESRTLLDKNGDIGRAELSELVKPLLDSLLMAEEAPLADSVSGNSDFAANFSARGPFDSQGRSLREFDLDTRTFRYPLSYLIYSDAIAALPPPVKSYLFEQIKLVLEGDPLAADYPHINNDQRSTILAIIRDTLPELLQ